MGKQLTVNKVYEDSCFILNDRKFSRIVEVAKERLERFKSTHQLNEKYRVNFSDGKELFVNSVQDILGLDNSKKVPVSKISAFFSIVDSGTLTHSIRIVFNSEDHRRPMQATCESEDLGWLKETIGAMEEQLERTIPTDFAYALNRRSGFIFVLFFGLIFGLLSGFLVEKKNGLTLTDDKAEELVLLSNSVKTDSEKIDFVYKYLSSTLVIDSRAKKIKGMLSETRTYLIGIPSLVALLSAFAAIFWFYPRNVFSWGDCGENYERTVERRKFLWYGVVLSLVIGVLGNLFVVGATT